MAHATLLAYPGYSVSGVVGPIDAFNMANLLRRYVRKDGDEDDPIFSWDIVTIDGKPVQGCGGIGVQPHRSIHQITSTDCILIPGFFAPLDFIGKIPKELATWLKAWHEKDVLIGAVCMGVFLLAETGLLDGKTATTNWMFAKYFRKLYPQVRLKPERLLTKDGSLICTGATTSYIDLCLYLIGRFGSEELAVHCSKVFLVEPRRRNQSPYFFFDFPKNHGDERVLAAQQYMEEKFHETISVEALALELGISPRQFKRRFKKATGDTPLTYLQRIRIESAKKRLETSTDTIEEITAQIGYEDSNSFRKLFKRYTSLSPMGYRERFTRIPGKSSLQ